MSEAVYHLDGVRLKDLAYLRKHGAVWIGERIAAVDAIAHERQTYGRAAA